MTEHTCSHCGATFPTRNKRDTHCRCCVHTCNIRFRDRPSITLHRIGLSFVCPCGRKFKSSTSIQKHCKKSTCSGTRTHEHRRETEDLGRNVVVDPHRPGYPVSNSEELYVDESVDRDVQENLGALVDDAADSEHEGGRRDYQDIIEGEGQDAVFVSSSCTYGTNATYPVLSGIGMPFMCTGVCFTWGQSAAFQKQYPTSVDASDWSSVGKRTQNNTDFLSPTTSLLLCLSLL